MLLITWGVKPLKQFHIIISKLKESKSQVKNTKTPRALNFINWSVKHNNLIIIIIKEELQYNKHP